MKRSIPGISLFLFFIFLSLPVSSQQVMIDNMPFLDELPSNSVQRVFQDRDGYMWFGTLDGLCRYDGYRLWVFRSNHQYPNLLADNEITSIAEDFNGNIWIGTKGGLNILDKKTFKIEAFPEKALGQQEIKYIHVASDSTVWVGAINSIYRYSPDLQLYRHYAYDPDDSYSLPGNGINSIFEDHQGDIWIMLWNSGLLRFDRDSGAFLRYPAIGENNNPFRMFQDSSKQYWICTWGDGIYHFNPNTNKSQMYTRQNFSERSFAGQETKFYSIVQDDVYGYLWAMSLSGIYAFEITEGNRINKIDIEPLFDRANNIFSEIIKDNEGNLWIGAFSEGPLQITFRKNTVENFPLESMKQKTGVAANITTLFKDHEGEIWFNQNRMGLGIYNIEKNEVKLYHNFLGLRDEFGLSNVSVITQSSLDGDIWIGYSDLAYVQVLRKNRSDINIKETIWLSNIHATPGSARLIYEDSKNNIWIASDNALFVKPYNDNSVKLATTLIKRPTSMVEDNKGTLWITTERSGLYQIPYRYDTQLNDLHIKNIRQSSSELPSDNIQDLCVNMDGMIWLGTAEGSVVRYDPKTETFRDYTPNIGIRGGAILSIETDMYGHIWIATNKRVIEYNPLNGAFTDYAASEDLEINSFLKNSSFHDRSEGHLYFGGNMGFVRFTPSERLHAKPKDSHVRITDIKVHNQSLILDNENWKYDMSRPYVMLEPGDNNIEINFSSLNYVYPKKIIYAYKMEGIDNDWVFTASNRQFAIYNQLKKGTYNFYIKATDENGLWSDKITRLKIYKRPAFYETWWATTIYVIIIILGIYWIMRIILNRVRLRNQLDIAEIEKKKSEELTQTKLKYFTNISHDLLTPLTIISYLIDDIENTTPDKKSQFETMRSNVSRLKRLLQQILDFKKVESGNMRLKISHGDIAMFIKDICYTQCLPLIKKKTMEFTFNSEPMQIPAYFDADKIDKIAFNLLSNAFKYTPKNGKVGIELKTHISGGHTFLTLKVKDTGIGIQPQNIEKIFTRFYTSRTETAAETNGIGLSLTKDLVEIHKGSIGVESVPEKGSVFTVTIPIDKSSYSSAELTGNTAGLVIDDDTHLDSRHSKESPAGENINALSRRRKENINILLVEDNEELLGLITNFFSMRYNVFPATDGKKALKEIHDNDIDIIISDVMIPEVNGLEFCRILKDNIETSHIPVILLTAKNSVEDRIECYNAGADAYISKPFELKVLEARVNNFLSAKKKRQKEFKSNVDINISTLEYPFMDENFLNNAVAIIEKHLSETDFNINTFTAHLNMSKSSLYRKIKTMTGLSPIEFIRNIRLKHACQMLRDKSISISEVAYYIGFSDPKYFTSCFKSEFNMTPSEYRRNVMTKSDVE